MDNKKLENNQSFNIAQWLFSKITKLEKIAFLSTFIIGLITHIFIFVNVLPNWDSMYNFDFNSAWLSMGRWFLGTAMELSSPFDLPWIIGLWSLIFLAITSVLLIRVLDIKSIFNTILIGGILVTFPVVTSTFSYMFLADAYMMGLMLATLSIYITKKYNRGYYIGGVILAFSLGIYQANLSFAVLLSVLLIIMNTMKSNTKVSDSIRYGIKFVITCVISLVLYYLILNLLLSASGQVLSEYQGANEGITINLNAIQNMINEFKSCFIIITGGSKPIITLMIIGVFFYLFAMMIYMIKKEKTYKNIFKILIILSCIIATPLITGYAYFISSSTIYHMVMRMSWVLFFIAVILFSELISNQKNNNNIFKIVFNYLPKIILMVIIYSYIITSNIAYLNMHQRYEKEYALALRIVNQLETDERYTNEKSVLFVGNRLVNQIENLYDEEIKYITGAEGNTFLPTDFHLKQFIKYYIGVELKTPSQDQVEEINSSSLIENMTIFPEKGSIELIQDVIVVRLGE